MTYVDQFLVLGRPENVVDAGGYVVLADLIPSESSKVDSDFK